jgi:hypothetical protein
MLTCRRNRFGTTWSRQILPEPLAAQLAAMEIIAALVTEHAGRGTLRNQDMVKRTQEAMDGIRKTKAEAPAK